MSRPTAGRRPVALCILDGWGISENVSGNAVRQAHTPNFDRIAAECPSSTLVTHGGAVGLPAGSIGNSEVGHLHIGAGRTILMDMQRISSAIRDGTFFTEMPLLDLARRIREQGGRAHIAGLVTDVGVHALSDHMAAAAKALTDLGLEAGLHVFTDGRDSAPGLAGRNIAGLESRLGPGARIETVSGRYYAMDRDKRWNRVEKAWRAIAAGQGKAAENAQHALELASAQGETDEFIQPSVIAGYGGIRDGDGVFFVNFRSDRMRQLAASLGDPEFSEFDVSAGPRLSAVLGMVPYFDAPLPWIDYLFRRPAVPNTLGEWVAAQGRTQFRLAETEKYPHVTYFLNGGRETPEPGEDRHMAQSPRVATYDLAPEMAAAEVADRFAAAVEAGYDLIVVNFANPDMVGHTGSLSAAIKACEAVDIGLGRAESAIRGAGGTMIVTADHGNCETMIDPETGGPHTAHTTNPVPVILGRRPGRRGAESGNICPTWRRRFSI